jgi:hypothetical protein
MGQICFFLIKSGADNKNNKQYIVAYTDFIKGGSAMNDYSISFIKRVTGLKTQSIYFLLEKK